MSRRYAVAHLQMLSLAPPDYVDAAARCGYDAVGLRLQPITSEEPPHRLITDKPLLRATRERLAATGIACIDVEALRFAPDDEPDDYQAFLETGAILGAQTVTTHLPDPERNRAIDKFGRLCELAQPFGLQPMIEFLPWTDVPNLATAAAICTAAAAQNSGILVDTLHFHRSASTLSELSRLPRSWLKMLHVCDCPEPTPKTAEGLIQTARRERLYPGEGSIDFAAILAALPADIWLTLEIPHDQRISEMGLEAYSRHALEATRSHLEAVSKNR